MPIPLKFETLNLNFSMSQQLVKVKPRKDYQWQQDSKRIYIKLPLPHTTLPKITITLCDLLLKVTSLQKKSTHVFDFFSKINYKSKQNRHIYNNGVLQLTLVKEEEKEWPDLLIQNLPISELKERRRESERRYEKTTQEIEERKEKLKDEYDRKATQELMRFEQEERDKVEGRKKEEEGRAVRELYQGITEEGRIVKHGESWEQKQRVAMEMLEKEEQEEELKRQEIKKVGKALAAQRKQQKSMFTNEEIQASEAQALKNSEQFEQIPVRKAQNVRIKFTQKPYPHVATRDTHYLDPPVPKNKPSLKSSQPLQQKSPLWLKSRGDQLLKNKDYLSSLSAYDKAINIDDKYLPAFLNRSYCHMKLFNFNECISDCESVMTIMQGMIGGESQGEKNNANRVLAKIGLRRAVCMAWRGDLEEGREAMRGVVEKWGEGLGDRDKQQIEEAMRVLDRREQSNNKKLEADIEYKKNNLDKCVDTYDSSIRIDSNEYSLSNKSLALLKLNRPRDVIQTCDRGLQQISKLTQHANINSNTNTSNYQASKLIIKLILRKAAALKALGQYNEGLEVIRTAIALDEQDKECKALYKEMEVECNKEIVKGLKEEAAQFLKCNKMAQALEKYNQCLKLIDPSEALEYLAILQNRCVCYLKLERYDDIVATAIRSLKIIHNQQNRLVAFDNSKIGNKQQKQKLTEFEVRILMRRANAYLHLGQSYNAKSDLERAQQLAPDNESIKAELEKVTAALKK